MTIHVTCRIPNTVCSTEKWKTTTVCRLQTAERNNGLKLIPVAVDIGITRQDSRKPMVYST